MDPEMLLCFLIEYASALAIQLVTFALLPSSLWASLSDSALICVVTMTLCSAFGYGTGVLSKHVWNFVLLRREAKGSKFRDRMG